MSDLKLSIELVPESSWQYNLRGLLKPAMWNEIRRKVYKSYKDHCAICKSLGKLHAHEVWSYDDENKVQKLINIIPLCYNCHMVKHIGFASLQASINNKDSEKFVKHFMKINKCDRFAYQKHLKESMEKYDERSKYEWQLDLQKLKTFE